MRAMKAQISLRIHAVWSETSVSAEYYIYDEQNDGND